MKLKLNIGERYAALLILNGVTNAGLKQWNVIKQGRDKLNITKEDISKFDIKFENGQLSFDTEKGKEVQTFDVDEQLTKLLIEKLNVLDKKNMIPKEVLPLAEKLLKE